MSDQVLHLSDAEFDSTVQNARVPVVVDFWAPWCGPCKRIGPIIEDLAEEYGDKVIFCKVNTDENPATPGKFDVMSIPTLMIFKGGELVERAVGLRPKPALKEWIDGVL
jgi:thioredoxin 1